jgi:uncharacterized protein YndB with AHSA1/START domain
MTGDARAAAASWAACDQQAVRASCAWRTALPPISRTCGRHSPIPPRLARWIGEVEGDLRLGGEFRFRFFATGSEGTGRVDACEPPRRLLLTMRDTDPQPGQPDEDVIEATLAADGDQTIVVVEERGMPLDLVAAYGVGVQIHVEDLAAHLAGRERCDAGARWEELRPAYEDLAANIG